MTLTKVSQELETLEREVRESHKVSHKMSESLNQLDVSIGKVDVEMDSFHSHDQTSSDILLLAF